MLVLLNRRRGNGWKRVLRSSHALQWHSLRAVKTNRNQDKISVRCLLWRWISREGRCGLIAGVKDDWRKNCTWTSEQKNSVRVRRFSLTQFSRFRLYASNVNCWRAQTIASHTFSHYFTTDLNNN